MQSPDTRNISLLNGVLRIDVHSGGVKTGYVDIGEADKFDLTTPDLSEIELFTSRDGSGAKVKGNITKYVPKFEISGQELSVFNLALQTLGVSDLLTQTGATVSGSPGETLTTNLVLGRSYRLAHRKVSAETIKAGASSLTAGTDYVLDAARGMVYFPLTSTATPGATVTAGYTYASISLRRVRGGAAKKVDCSIYYTGDSTEGLIYDCEIFHGLIKPSAALSLINPPGGNEYARWSIVGDVLGDQAGFFGGATDNPYFNLIEVGVVS
jgi:hypothetical protein